MLVIWKKKSREKERKYRIAEMVASATTKMYWLLLGKEPQVDYDG